MGDVGKSSTWCRNSLLYDGMKNIYIYILATPGGILAEILAHPAQRQTHILPRTLSVSPPYQTFYSSVGKASTWCRKLVCMTNWRILISMDATPGGSLALLYPLQTLSTHPYTPSLLSHFESTCHILCEAFVHFHIFLLGMLCTSSGMVTCFC